MFFFNKTTLKSLNDGFLTPTDESSVVCTPHEYDSKEFDDVSSLIKFVANLWWQIPHKIENRLELSELGSTKDALEYNWTQCDIYNSLNDSFVLPKKIVLINEPMEFLIEK